MFHLSSFVGLLIVFASLTIGMAAEPKSLGVLESFDDAAVGPYQKGFIDSWRWNEALRAEFRPLSRLEIVETQDTPGRSLRIRIDDPRVVAAEGVPQLRLAPHFPPEVDAVRLRVKVVAGEVTLYLGGPTAYYGNSDVFSERRTLKAESPARFVDVDFSLNHPTWRNYRRSGFSTDAPRNYYTRWGQEPLGLYVGAESKGEVLIDRIEPLALGEGRPFPQFRADDVRPVQMIADYENGVAPGGDRARTFNLYMAANEVEWFDESWQRTKPLRFAPLNLSVVDAGHSGKKSLACTGHVAEEVHCTGVRTAGDAEANAFAATIKLHAADDRSTLFGVGPALPIDFLVFIAPKEKPFPWDRFGPSAELRAAKGPGFDYNLTHRLLMTATDVDFAIYQARRYATPDRWTKLVMPAADFTCIYGHGSYRRKLLDHEPLTCDDVVAMAWLNPWCRAGRRLPADTTMIDELSFVHVPGTAEELRSYWQVPDVKSLVTRDAGQAGRRTKHIALPSDTPADVAPSPRPISKPDSE